MDDNPLEAYVEKFTQAIDEMVNKLPEAKRPFGHEKLKPADQLQRYMQVREDPNAFAQLIERHGVRETIEYAKKMEKLLEGQNANASGT